MKAEARRQRAHRLLDRYLDQLLDPDELPNGESARHLYWAGAHMLREVMGPDLRQIAAPIVMDKSPAELRNALMECLRMVAPIWPQHSEPSLNISEVLIAFDKLNCGETPAFLMPPKGGPHAWTERRFRFLAALWAMYLQHWHGEKAELANNRVARAFDPTLPAHSRENGRLSEGSLQRWRREAKTMPYAEIAIGLACREGPRYAHVQPLNEMPDAERRACESLVPLALYGYAFGSVPDSTAVETLDEVGRRYQDFLQSNLEKSAAYKRERRAKKLT